MLTTLHGFIPMAFHLGLKLHPKWKEKQKYSNEKPQKCMCTSNVLAFLSKPERSLIPQLDTVVIEVSLVKALRLRGNPRRLYRAKHLPSRNWTYGDTGFYSGQTSYLNMKVLTFGKDEKIVKPLLP